MTLIITEKAPAKINLALDTPMRYIDGLPRWNMVMNSIDLADYVTIETHQHQHRIKVYTDSSFFLMTSAILPTRLPIFLKIVFTLMRA